MPKKIHEIYWPFNVEIQLPAVVEKQSFLWWSWNVTSHPTKPKYSSVKDLLDEVNHFIAHNEIEEIISFKNTARYVHVVQCDYGCEGDWIEQEGGIKLTYFK